MRPGDAYELVGARSAGVVNGHHLDVLGEVVGDLPVRRRDLALDLDDVELRATRDPVHRHDQFVEGVGDDEVRAVPPGHRGVVHAVHCASEGE